MQQQLNPTSNNEKEGKKSWIEKFRREAVEEVLIFSIKMRLTSTRVGMQQAQTIMRYINSQSYKMRARIFNIYETIHEDSYCMQS